MPAEGNGIMTAEGSRAGGEAVFGVGGGRVGGQVGGAKFGKKECWRKDQ